MFAPGPPYPRTTFRVQVFTAPGARPLVLATQEAQHEGCSLVNGAQHFASRVWQRLLPQEPHPPLWIQNLIMGARDDGCRLVTFTPAGDYQVTHPRWQTLKTSQLKQLVVGPLDLARGPYPRRVEDPEPVQVLEPMEVRHLPRPGPDADRACRPAGISEETVEERQRWPRRGGTGTKKGCCWYHGGDWHQVCDTAVELVRRAQAESTAWGDIPAYVLDRAKSTGLSRWGQQALMSLVIEPIDPDEEGGLVNGRHRTQVLLEAGVREVVVARYRLPDPQPATGSS